MCAFLATSGTRRQSHRQLVRRVERRNLVTLSQRGIVEDGGEEIVQPGAKSKHRLPDMKQLGGTRTDYVHAEQPSVSTMKEHLEKAAVIAEDLAAGDLPVACDPDFVGYLVLRQRLLGRADHRDLRHRVDPDWKVVRHRRRWHAERVTGGETPLLARRRRETRIADDIARGEDVWHRGAELRVNRDAPPIVGGESGVLESQPLRRAGASHREESHVGDNALARLELQHRTRWRAVV